MNKLSEVVVMGRRLRSIVCTILAAFFSTGAINCADSIYFPKENEDEPVVNLTKAGNNVTLSQGFYLDKDMMIRINCLGEGVYDDLTDYGWIINADTRKKIWVMDIDRTKHAGGAKKNRLADEKILLRKGSYVAFYKTDDSHSCRRWNDAPPVNEEQWGLSLSAENGNRKFVSLFDDTKFRSSRLIAEIVRMGDKNFKSRAFRLNKDTRINIYAIGEGNRSEMFDYGWIEDEAGNTVWKMDYKKTIYAGGAVKNRLAEDTILLTPGDYKVCYKTDDSHSFNNWNANPPEDAVMYGLTLTTDDSILAGKDQPGD